MMEKDLSATQIVEKGTGLTLQQSGIVVSEVINSQSTPEEDKKVLRKIDRWCVSFTFARFTGQS